MSAKRDLSGYNYAAISSLVLTADRSALPRYATMITDDELYRLAIFLGCASMVLIVVYNFLEVNSREQPSKTAKGGKATAGKTAATLK